MSRGASLGITFFAGVFWFLKVSVIGAESFPTPCRFSKHFLQISFYAPEEIFEVRYFIKKMNLFWSFWEFIDKLSNFLVKKPKQVVQKAIYMSKRAFPWKKIENESQKKQLGGKVPKNWLHFSNFVRVVRRAFNTTTGTNSGKKIFLRKLLLCNFVFRLWYWSFCVITTKDMQVVKTCPEEQSEKNFSVQECKTKNY